MKFAIIGVGGVGGYFGGLLAKAGKDVTFVARGEQYHALTSNGLEVRSVEGTFHLKTVQVVDSPAKLKNPDVIFITTKAYNRDEAATALSTVAHSSTIVIPLLNGIDNDSSIRNILPNAEVHPGLVYIISARTAPGIIEQTGGPRTMIFGDRSASVNPRLKAIEKELQGAGMLATASTDIERDIWLKFVWLTTFAGMTALCRSPIGPIVCDPEAFQLLVRCLDEGILVAASAGIQITDMERSKMIERSAEYRSNSPGAKSSLLVDIENQRPTEIDALSGAIVRLGKKHQILTPIHQLIHCAVRLASLHYQKQAPHPGQ